MKTLPVTHFDPHRLGGIQMQIHDLVTEQRSRGHGCGRLADLVRAVRTAAGPEATVGRRVVGGDLTARQWQVAACMTEGLDATAIAHRLSISKHTARTHIRAIYRRLDAHSATEAVALIRR
jgi:DNA-binding NarL/FixJ family response regulator